MSMYDVAVIGAGVVGCAIARELAGHDLSVVILEARHDVGDGTSKANTAILHTGFDATPGTLEADLVQRGYELLGQYAEEAGIPVERIGAVLVAWDAEQLDALPQLLAKAERNGYADARIIDADGVYELVPALAAGAMGGLLVPGESIIDPWSTTLAFANDALARGAVLRLRAAVNGAARTSGGLNELTTDDGIVSARWVINAAGLGADRVDRLFGHERFTVVPRRGELVVFDKQARRLTPRIVLPVPSSRGKGVLVSPTVFGNVMVGPTAEDLRDRSDTSTTTAGIHGLRERARQLMPALLDEEVTAVYAGLRAATEHSDYVIDADPDTCYVCVGGIRSTGLTASLAIAEHVRALLEKNGVSLMRRPDLPPTSRVPNIGEAFPRPHECGDLIDRDPEYGTVVCFCERVTRGEVRDAMSSALPPCDLDGLRRRTRVLMGRCQGFFCGAEVQRLLDEGVHS